ERKYAEYESALDGFCDVVSSVEAERDGLRSLRDEDAEAHAKDIALMQSLIEKSDKDYGAAHARAVTFEQERDAALARHKQAVDDNQNLAADLTLLANETAAKLGEAENERTLLNLKIEQLQQAFNEAGLVE